MWRLFNFFIGFRTIFSWFIVVLYSFIFIFVCCMFDLDSQQLENYKMIYLHVPLAWIMMLVYIVCVILSFFFLYTKSNLLYRFMLFSAGVGSLVTFFTLVSGSLWGYPMWGAFWVWDARLTSVLVLLGIYLLYYIILSEVSGYFGSLFCIGGFVNLPIIKYSVDWWTTLHQSSSITAESVFLEGGYLFVLFLLFLLYILFIIVLFIFFIVRLLVCFRQLTVE